MRQKYYSFAFAEDGSSTPAIPDAADPNGFVSYEAGFTYDYQRVLIAGPGNVPPADALAKSPTWINFNAILKDATTNLQQYQQNGIPEYITPAQNGGTNFTYGCGSIILYSASGNPPFIPYMALTATASTPGTDATWLNLLTLAAPMSHGVFAIIGTVVGSWTAPPGVTQVLLDMTAGGGAGGFGTIGTNGGGGASSGMSLIAYPLTVVPGTTYTITLGAPGLEVINSDGASSAPSMFDTLITLQGGAGGKNNGTPGASVGQNSQAGVPGIYYNGTSWGGAGGGTFYGNGPPGGMASQRGLSAIAPGGGGGGGAGGQHGGNGGQPYCRISW